MATILCRRGWMNFKGLPVLAMRFQCKSISSSSLMADSGNTAPLWAYSKSGTDVDLKAKLKKAEVDGTITELIKRLAMVNKTKALIFEEVEDGSPLYQCGIRNGDELTTVNHAKVNSSDDINYIASVIRDCSPTVMLGIKRRRSVGSVPIVVLFQLDDADSNPVHKFSGFCWNVSPQNISFLRELPKALQAKKIIEYYFSHELDDVEVTAESSNKQLWLTYEDNLLTFQKRRSGVFSKWTIKVYSVAGNSSIFTPIIFIPQGDQTKAVAAPQNDRLQMVGLTQMDVEPRPPQKPTIGSAVFLHAFAKGKNGPYHVQSSQTDKCIIMETQPNGSRAPNLSAAGPTLLTILDNTGEVTSLSKGEGTNMTHLSHRMGKSSS